MASASWTRLWHDPPGKRFSRRYERLRGNQDGLARRILRWFAAVVLIVVGVVLLPLPGPGFVPLGIGGALLAGESRGVADWLDRLELRGRALWARWRR